MRYHLGIRPPIGLFLVILLVVAGSCSKIDSTSPKTGWEGLWDFSYEDKTGVHQRFLNIKKNAQEQWAATMDEPAEDWYEVPIQNFSIRDNVIRGELWWGLEKFQGTLTKNDAAIKGNQMISTENESKPFVYKRLPAEEIPAYKFPRLDAAGKKQSQYSYAAPSDDADGLAVGNLSDFASDAAPIKSLMKGILASEIPGIHSVLIQKDGKLVLEEYFFGYDKRRKHRVHSVTKSFTSALIGIALDKEILKKVDGKVYEFFPDQKQSPWVSRQYDITLKHLLTMTAGLQWRPLTSEAAPDIMEMYKSKNCLEYMLARKQMEPPGTHFFYNDGLTILLGIILDRASGETVNDFAEENLFRPLGITNYSWDVNADGTANTGGGLKLRPRDMIKFGLLFLNKGLWQGRRIVSEKWIAESTSRQTPPGETEYGYQWWMCKFTVNRRLIEGYCAKGHGEQFIFVIPQLNLVAAFTAGNFFQEERRPMEIMTQYILPAFVDRQPPPSEQPLTEKEIRDLSGVYANAQNEPFQIIGIDGKLFLIDPLQRRVELFKIGDRHFYAKDPKAEGCFIEDDRGRILRLDIYRDGIKVEEWKKTSPPSEP